MKLYIKNMVCSRCKMVVKSEFEKLGLQPISVELGEVELQEEINDTQKEVLLENLQDLGFDLIDDKKTKTVERIKNLIVDLVHHKNNDLKINLSEYLSENLNQDYNSLSNLFSEIENTTIEKYFISQKIEKVKELLIYNELSLSEIADILNYSNVAHLSNQFKKITGFTPTSFKQSKDKMRIQIENL
ncbi:helix-turn-helix domain-containing protein [Flavobacterium sharifuzzamanii]|uniref:helix-turn-helix domain-containing protein n=1 Tax=Flavobacterium sharifuzzamanii TaxID=2211133 RepID=UPI000DABE721|nr:AraC family transcriptional regulator [Flavobacterium sharifuzzamanii]KAF2081297.1 helix-turn-helix transcriptional regulator [Flavobacterium sharifuzzamanii]